MIPDAGETFSLCAGVQPPGISTIALVPKSRQDLNVSVARILTACRFSSWLIKKSAVLYLAVLFSYSRAESVNTPGVECPRPDSSPVALIAMEGKGAAGLAQLRWVGWSRREETGEVGAVGRGEQWGRDLLHWG